MSITARVQTMDRDVELLIDETLSPEAYSQAFGREARRIIEDQDDQNAAMLGRDVTYKTFVDGVQGTDLESAERRIAAEWDLLETLFEDVFRMLLEESPVLTGAYGESITLFADGVPVAPTAVEAVPEASEYFFAATVPYARKIERGQSAWAPDGVFQGIAAVASRRFGNIARIRYSMRSIQGGAIGDWAAGTGYVAAGRLRNRPGARRTEWLTRQPAIVIVPR
jgi:hypothetical protein